MASIFSGHEPNRVCFEQSRETNCLPSILSKNWRMEIVLLQDWVWLGGVADFKTNCPYMGPGPTGGQNTLRERSS